MSIINFNQIDPLKKEHDRIAKCQAREIEDHKNRNVEDPIKTAIHEKLHQEKLARAFGNDSTDEIAEAEREESRILDRLLAESQRKENEALKKIEK